MTRILIAECKQEVSSFNPSHSRFADFRVARRGALVDHHRRCREEVGGALSVFDAEAGVELAPTFGASANTSGGILAGDDFAHLRTAFLDELEGARAAGPVDGVYF